jgi:hypothetical protein
MDKITLRGKFSTLNEYIEAERGNFHTAARLKKQQTRSVQLDTIGILPVTEYPVRITFTWFCKNIRTDPDNICFAKKSILDGLQVSHVLAGDGWKHIAGFEDIFYVDKEDPRVEIEIVSQKGVSNAKQKNNS